MNCADCGLAPCACEDVDFRDTLPTGERLCTRAWTYRYPPDTQAAYERGLTRFILGAVALLAICLAVALLTRAPL